MMAEEKIQPDDLRRATFPQARKGYDREAVHSLLDRVAELVERGAGAVAESAPGVKRELEKVGERTASILTAAEDAATKVRAEAKDYADRLRSSAEAEARKATLTAGTRAEELIAEAEVKAEKIIDDAIVRRRKLNLTITSLVERQDEIAREATRLGEELIGAVGALRGGAAEKAPVVDDQLEIEPSPDAEPARRFDPASHDEPTEVVDTGRSEHDSIQR